MNDRSSRSPGSNRASLFETAIESFAELGFNGASMRTVASRAGMALSNLYNYAPSKQDLLVQILRKANYDHLSATEWAMSGAGKEPADRLAAGVRAYVKYITENTAEVLVAHTEVRYLDTEHRDRLVVARDRIDSLLRDVVEEGVSAGLFHTPRPADTTRAILVMCAGIARWYKPGGPLSADEISDHYARLALAMVEADISHL